MNPFGLPLPEKQIPHVVEELERGDKRLVEPFVVQWTSCGSENGSVRDGKFDRPDCCPTPLSHYCPKEVGFWIRRDAISAWVFNRAPLHESSPEKAGVGGSIPSLATI